MFLHPQQKIDTPSIIIQAKTADKDFQEGIGFHMSSRSYLKGRSMIQLSLIIILGLLYNPSLFALNAPSFIIEGEPFAMKELNKYNMGIYDEPLSTSEIKARLAARQYEAQDVFHLIYGKYSHNVYLIENRTPDPVTAVLKYGFRFRYSKLYQVINGQLQPARSYSAVSDAFVVQLPPGPSKLVEVRQSAGTISHSMKTTSLYDQSSVVAQLVYENHLNAFIYGIVSIMIFYNLGLLCFFRKTYFLYYSLFCSASMYLFMSLSGYVPWSLSHMGPAVILGGVSLILLCNSSLSLKKTYPRLYSMSFIFVISNIVHGLHLWLSGEWSILIVSAPLTLLFCLWASIVRTIDGYRPAMYLLIGWSIFLSAALILILNTAYIGSSYLMPAGVIGFALEVCFFSFAIGQKARFSEQKALHENMHAFKQMQKVFYSHQIKQIKQGRELEQTMPTHMGVACVISFDIIESSKLKHPSAKIFLKDSIKSCLAILDDSYEEQTLTAKGFRIKEMGDGFLCSVGYPFRYAENIHPAVAATKLAFQFIEVFQEQVELLGQSNQIFCSIGLALGGIEGYYPNIGTVEYDVYGPSIVLATRYESMRKTLFARSLNCHLMILQEEVYRSLPPELKAEFEVFDLKKANITVRDDKKASKLYLKQIEVEASTSALSLAR